MKKLKEKIVKLQSDIEINRMYKRIEKEESNRHELATEAELYQCLKVTERAIAEAKKARTYEDGLLWLGVAKRYSIRFFKIKQQLEKTES